MVGTVEVLDHVIGEGDEANRAWAWGLMIRLLGVVYVIAIGSLLPQIEGIAGSNGLSPVQQVLARTKQDFPPLRTRLLYFPTLYHIITPTNAVLRFTCILGVGAGLTMVIGGAWVAQPAAWSAWVVLLTLDAAVDLNYPWDCLLFEAGALALALPPTHTLPAIAAVATPPPFLRWAFRWLLFRVLFGFGKLKFVGSGPKDSCYIKSFCIGMPLPTPIGWWVHHLPLVLHQAALAGMFAVEMFLPFALFVAGLPRWLAGFGILGLQIGIQLTGNFGYFNVLTSVLCIPSLLDPLDPGFNLLNQQSSAIQSAVSWILALSGLISLAFNSWCARAWPFWPALCPPADSSTSPRASSIVFKVADLFRLLVTFRLVHAYGVFPPHSSPPVRWVPIIEGLGRLPGEPKNSKLQWRRYRYKYMTSSATDGPNPAFIAPFHPRWAHAVFYESFGLNAHNFQCSLNIGNPYRFSRATPLHRLVQRLLMPATGHNPVEECFAYNPYPAGGPAGPPVKIRVTLYAFLPTTPKELASTGRWWREVKIGPHLPATGPDPEVWADWLPAWELWHWDSQLWRQRAAAADTSGYRQAVLDGSNAAGVDKDEEMVLESFWNEFIPAILGCSTAEDHRHDPAGAVKRIDWTGQNGVAPMSMATNLLKRFDRESICGWEKILGKLTISLYTRMIPHIRFFADVRASTGESNHLEQDGELLEDSSYCQLWLGCHRVILHGKTAYFQALEAAAAKPGLETCLRPFTSLAGFDSTNRKSEVATRCRIQRLHLLGVLWPQTVAFHAVKAAMARRIISADNNPKPDKHGLVPGFIHLLPTLAAYAEPENPTAVAALSLTGKPDSDTDETDDEYPGFGGFHRVPFPLQLRMPTAWGDWLVVDRADASEHCSSQSVDVASKKKS